MDMKFSKIITFAIVLSTIGVTHAEWMDESTVKTAAEAFTLNDAIGATILKGCTVAGLTQRQNLWIVSLEPSGHIVMSGSDLADPIIGFSKNNFVEPDPESPAFAVLEGADASIAAREAQGGGTRHERWTKLLGGGTSKTGLLKAADVENPDSVVIPPFLESHYNQWQPYNDYCPIYEANTNAVRCDSYRGRCPCGCVATAAAQMLKHFQWPARIDAMFSHTHSFSNLNGQVVSFPLRFNGFAPWAWSQIESQYVTHTDQEVWVPIEDKPGSYYVYHETDLRGLVKEVVRYPIARLIMFADVLAHMSFGTDGSSANYGTVALNASDWYTLGTWVSADDTRVQADIANGVPVQISIPGHAVVGHGWATDGGNQYIYLNYGWGGSNDGYYNVNGSTIQEVYVGHYPRAKPQIDPLPKVCETSLTLNWHFPDFYTNNLSGFTVSISKTATTPSTLFDDFSASSGSLSSSDMYVGTDADYGYDGNLLYTEATTAGVYTFPGSYMLTSASVMTFKLLSFSALGAVYEVQASFNGGDWETVCTPSLKSDWGSSGWAMERVYLGGHGGESVRFRVRNSRNSLSYYPTGRILLDDFTVTNVLAPVAPEIQNVGKEARSLALNELEAGATYSFTVTPDISDALVSGETSKPVSTVIAGTRNTPISGEQTYTPMTLTFSASDTSGTWSYTYDSYGSVVDDSTVKGIFNCSVTAQLPGELSEVSSTLSFQWSASNYQNTGTNSWSAVFIDKFGNETNIGNDSSTSDVSLQSVNLSLSKFKGQGGTIRISYSHSGNAWKNSAIVLSSPQITNILVPSVPAVAWDTETLTALGTPEILSVSAVEEEFYAECGTNATTFAVTCSESVTSLEALPSHLALVDDDDVSVTPKGKGRFTVTVTPRGITEYNERSRMILTLAATDSNGTTAYKDLSLRFAPVDAVVSAVKVDATTSSGSAFSVDVPYEWVEANGLVPAGSAASAYEAALAANADADSDGIPNWAEYVCGTIPTDSNSKLITTISIDENGTPVVGYDPSEGFANGFKAVIKGTNNLSEDFAEWQVTTGTKDLHFYRVEIIPEFIPE